MNYGISILFRAIPLVMALFCFGFGTFILCSGDDPQRIVAGQVVFSLGMICIALYATAATIIRQIIHTYGKVAKYALPFLGYSAAVVTLISGIRLFTASGSSAGFVGGHVVAGVGLITMCVATAATSSTRFSLIPRNSKDTGHEIPDEAFTRLHERLFRSLIVLIALTSWIWAFMLLSKSDLHPKYFVAGHVMAGIACICTSLISLVASIVRQVRNVYGSRERLIWPLLVLVMGSIAFFWGLFVILMNRDNPNGAIGYIMVGLGLVCYSISSKVILLAKIWRNEFKLANRIPLIPILTALACLFLSSFLFDQAAVQPDFFIPARVLAGLGAICFTLFSIVSILESGTSARS